MTERYDYPLWLDDEILNNLPPVTRTFPASWFTSPPPEKMTPIPRIVPSNPEQEMKTE